MSAGKEPLVDRRPERAELRLLILCDRPSASQEVHLFRALRRRRAAGLCALAVYSEEATSAAAKRKRDWVGRALDKFRPHALIFSRFAGPEAAAAIDAARTRGVAIVTHLDDFLLEVPPDLGPEKIRQHMRPERIAALTDTLARADLLYISTPALAERVRRAGFSTPAIVSQLQSCADPDEIAPPPRSEPLLIGYQGTRSHIHDLRMIAPAILAVMATRPSVTLELFGTVEPPEELLVLGPRLRRIPPSAPYDAFLKRLRDCRWQVGLAPLRPIEFNTFRTYTKWTEYSIAGAAVLASDSAPYRPVMQNGGGTLVSDDNWERALINAIDDDDARLRMVASAQHLLKGELTLARQEEQVLAMLRQAIGA